MITLDQLKEGFTVWWSDGTSVELCQVLNPNAHVGSARVQFADPNLFPTESDALWHCVEHCEELASSFRKRWNKAQREEQDDSEESPSEQPLTEGGTDP